MNRAAMAVQANRPTIMFPAPLPIIMNQHGRMYWSDEVLALVHQWRTDTRIIRQAHLAFERATHFDDARGLERMEPERKYTLVLAAASKTEKRIREQVRLELLGRPPESPS